MFYTKEQIITNYIKNVDFNGNWSYRQMEKELHKLLGEKPAINVLYKKDGVLNEFNSEATEISVVDKIEIIFSPELNREFKRLTFTINGTI